MSRTAIGWTWVAGQAALLLTLVFVPGRSDWPTPGWLDATANVLFYAGLGIIVLAALGLGRALTPTPVPTHGGALTTTGLYRYVRHPIYTGVLTVVAGMMLRSASWLHVAIAVVTFIFFDRKAAWEEQQLAARYPEYPDYATKTPRFLPRFPVGAARDR